MLLMFLHLSAVNPNITVNLTGVTTVNQGLVELNKAFPDWEHNYQVNEFDCSEQSALVYEYFKCAGLEPELKLGYDWPHKYGHAWVVCQGKTIECMELRVATNQTFYDHFNPFKYYSQAERDGDLDWWNSGY